MSSADRKLKAAEEPMPLKHLHTAYVSPLIGYAQQAVYVCLYACDVRNGINDLFVCLCRVGSLRRLRVWYRMRACLCSRTT